MGPEGGSGGGMVVAEGTPEQVAEVEASHTGTFLRDILAGRQAAPPAKRPKKAAAKPRKKTVAARA
jgi:excinuclease ABC subunit A